jgi:peptidoglycan/LPS O-acetylase OafA/YrhL
VYLMTTSLLILFASLSYRYVELPARAFFKRRTRRPEIIPAPTAPAGAELAYAPVIDDSSSNR